MMNQLKIGFLVDQLLNMLHNVVIKQFSEDQINSFNQKCQKHSKHQMIIYQLEQHLKYI